MRVAVIGYGVIGHLHAAILQKQGMLYAICDTDPNALASAAADHPHVRLFGDHVEMLDTADLDAVHICTPHYLHATMVIAALQRNIHVLCEKPLCIREDELQAVWTAERASSAQLGVCLQNRYNPANRYVKKYLQNAKQATGVGQVAWHRTAAYYASGSWRGKWSTEGGGVLINQALHTLDLMQWFLGMPETVTASVDNLTLQDVIEVEDTATICCHGAMGFVFFATTSSQVDHPVLLQLCVDGKQLTVLPDRVLIGQEQITFEEADMAPIKPCYGNGHERLITDFYDHIASGRHFAIDGQEGAKVVRLILAAYQSHGKPVRFLTAEQR